MDELKDISWEGSSLEDLLKFPEDARRAMGYQLHLVQSGEMPDDWKVLSKLGKGVTGVYEIRLITSTIFRTFFSGSLRRSVAQ